MKITSVLIIILVGCVLTFPFIFHGISFESDDGIIHARWYFYFSQQFWSGDFYPRWLSGMNNGLGSPVFFYYPPVPYFLTSLLKPFFPHDNYGIHQLGVSASLALILSGLSANLWLKQIADKRSALIGAILFMASPYHLIADIYIRCSFAELWTFAWLPLILYFTHKILDGNRLASVGLAVSYALLIMTHLPTTLIFSVVPICYAVVLKSDKILKTLSKVTVPMAFGIGLSAIYLYPAMTMQQYVFVEKMSTGYFSYENWLFFANSSFLTDDKLIIVFLVLDLIGIAGCAFVISRADLKLEKLRMFWLIVAVISVLMMTEVSKPVWMLFPSLQKIQFPFRFNVILTLAVAALVTLAVAAIKKASSVKLDGVKLIILVLIAAWLPALILTGLDIFSPLYTERTHQQIIEKSKDVPEYRPRWSKSMSDIDWETSKDENFWDVQMAKEYDDLIQRTGVSEANVSKVKIVQGDGQVDVISWKPREIRLRVKTSNELKVDVSQFYFPNWTAKIVDEQQELTVRPSEPDGLISLSIPKGDHQILIELNRSDAESNGRIISLFAGLCLLFYTVFIIVVRRNGVLRGYFSR